MAGVPEKPSAEDEDSFAEELRSLLGEAAPAPPQAGAEEATAEAAAPAEVAEEKAGAPPEAEAPAEAELVMEKRARPGLALPLLAQRLLTLNLEGPELRLVSFQGGRVEAWAALTLDPGLFQGGFVADAEGVAEAVTAALKSRRLDRGRLFCSFPGLGTISQVLSLPRTIRQADLKAFIPREISRQLSITREGYHFFWKLLPLRRRMSREVYALAVPREPLTNYMETLRLLPVKLKWLELKALALARAAGRRDAIIAHAEPYSIEILIVVEGVPRLMRSILLGDEAMPLEDVVARLLGEVEHTLTFYQQTRRGAPLPETVGLCLSGRLARREVAEEVAAVTGRPVLPPQPPLALPADFPLPPFMVNLGLALKALARQ